MSGGAAVGDWSNMAISTVPATPVGSPSIIAGEDDDDELAPTAAASTTTAAVERVASTGSLPLGAAHVLGFSNASSQVTQVTREHLIEQGVPVVQANARVVRQHEEEVLLMHFRVWILLFSLVVCLAYPAMFGLLVWLIAANLEIGDVECAVPLQTWVQVVFCIVLYNFTINRPTPRGSCVQRLFCRWSRDPENPQPMPLRVWVYNLTFITFTFVWNCLGLHWVTIDDGRSASKSGLPSCQEVAPELYKAVKVYSSVNLAVTLFMYINVFGLGQLLRIALHRGLLHTNQGAPSGSLDANTEVVGLDDEAIVESPSCSICLEDFEAENPIVKTKACKHVFHRQCLKGWLQVNRTCPLCRQDLGKAVTAWG
mmetsp:Transcript_9173/g.23553  ORF Transcript_9173/g.23553 Transcript_9173/m.23553 type:complete len:369 (-) Transcript_9173:112-1218(-)